MGGLNGGWVCVRGFNCGWVCAGGLIGRWVVRPKIYMKFGLIQRVGLCGRVE